MKSLSSRRGAKTTFFVVEDTWCDLKCTCPLSRARDALLISVNCSCLISLYLGLYTEGKNLTTLQVTARDEVVLVFSAVYSFIICVLVKGCW